MIALFTSMTSYRLAFHPLRSFGGPLGNRISKLWHVYKVRGSQNHLYLDALYHKYGDFVRTGSSELTVYHPEVFQVIDGPGTTCKKGPWYDMLHPLVALKSIREKSAYVPRRRKWDQALKATANSREEEKILKCATLLVQAFQRSPGTAINVTDWFSFFSFDVIGSLAFNKSFETLATGHLHHALILLKDGLDIIGLLSPVPWLAQILLVLPGATKSWKAMIAWCSETMTERLETSHEGVDASHWLMEAAKIDSPGKPKLDTDNLFGDAVAIMIAGSHAVASTLNFLFKELVENPEKQDILYQELASHQWETDREKLKDLPYLNAAINETLRLYPVIPTNGLRLTTASGVHVAGRYVPPETTIVAPRHTIGRLQSCFELPNQFLPERWLSRPRMVKDIRAFNPFGLGRHSCPGKHLGLFEVRLVTALILTSFTVEFAPGEDGTTVAGEMRDCFTSRPGELRLRFEPRRTRAS